MARRRQPGQDQLYGEMDFMVPGQDAGYEEDTYSTGGDLLGPTGPASGNTGVAGNQTPAPVPPPAAPPVTSTAPRPRTTPPPPGVSSEKWASGHVSPKYAWKEVAGQHNLSTQAGRDAALAQLKAQYPQYFANATLEGDKLRIGGELHKDFQGISLFDVIKDIEGEATMRWGTPEQDAINQQIAASQGGGGGFGGGMGDFGTFLSGLFGSGGGFGGGSSSTTGGGSSTGLSSELDELLMGFLNENKGGLNSDRVKLRTQGARENLERQRMAEMDTMKGQLSQRGLLGSGPEASAIAGLGEDIASRYGTEVNDIMANESQLADQSFLGGLGLGVGREQAGLDRQVDQFNAETSRGLGVGRLGLDSILGNRGLDNQRELGLGQLALGNLEQNRTWNQFLAQFGLDRDIAMEAIRSGRINDLIPLLEQMYKGSDQASGGYI